MNFISLSLAENQNFMMQRDILSSLKHEPEKSNQIKQGMSPKEIAEITSDHLMEVVRQQFENAKREFQAREKK